MKHAISQLLQKEADAILNIPQNNDFEAVIELIYKAVHQNNGKLVASGMGKAGQIAINIATTLSSTGTPAVFIHPSDAQHGDLGLIQKNDILLLISNSGKTREIVEFFYLARNLYAHLPVVVITGNPISELGELADITISTGNPQEVCPLGMAPTTSTTVMTVIGDILVVELMHKIDFSKESYAKLHHGGYLGSKARGVH
jgi:arabinose-5-phosphate isomerase